MSLPAFPHLLAAIRPPAIPHCSSATMPPCLLPPWSRAQLLAVAINACFVVYQGWASAALNAFACQMIDSGAVSLTTPAYYADYQRVGLGDCAGLTSCVCGGEDCERARWGVDGHHGREI